MVYGLKWIIERRNSGISGRVGHAYSVGGAPSLKPKP